MFSVEIMSSFKAIKTHLKLLYDKQNLTLVVISYEIYETRRRLVSYISYEMTTSVRCSIYLMLIFGSAVFFAFCIAYCSENKLKINITPYGEKFYHLTYEDKNLNLASYIFEKFFTYEK